jgi:hypothetical protein
VGQRTLINLALLLMVAGLALVIALAPDEEPPLALELLSNENPRAVSRIRLKQAADTTIELRRVDGSWRLVEPIGIAANDFRVQTLVQILEAPVHTRIDTTPRQLARFGLAPPRARILLDEKEVLFGDTEPIHGRRYLLYDGKVALVDDTFFSHVSSKAANYVNLALLGRDPDPQSLRLPGIRVYRDAGDWRLDSDGGNVDADSISMLVDAWRHAQATAVRPYEQSLDWNDVIRIELADGELRFDLAHTRYEVILGRPELGIQYHLTKGGGARLLGIKAADKSG